MEPIKEPRNISGIYFRFKNSDTAQYENRVFEDLPESEQDRQLEGMDKEGVKNIAKILGKTLRGICDKFDIIRQADDIIK